MPTTGTNTLTLSDATVTTFKVYDDGGKSGNYSDNCSGTLTLTAPTVYVLQLSGSNSTENGYDKLTVYDGSAASDSKFIDEVSFTQTLTTVVSSGQSMMLYFYSDGSFNYAGLDLTVTVVPATYTITYELAGGTVATENPATYTIESSDITLNNPTKDGYTFAGWTGTDLDAATETVTIAQGSTGNRSYTAMWTKNELILFDDDSSQSDGSKNADIISAASGDGKQYAVTLQDRTLYKDGSWNTLCLPFAVSSEQINETTNPLYGATIKTLDPSNSNLAADGTLTLKFTTVYDPNDAPSGSIEAGKPYIVKWATTGDNISNPVFNGVTIESTTPTEIVSTDGKVTFVGQYSPFTIDADNINEILYVASGNKIGYSKSPRTLKSFRAHFWVQPNGDTQAARMINIDFGDGEATSITTTYFTDYTDSDGAWYTLDGRKLDGQPTAKGVYVKNGKKVVIK